ncbi:hypothetical protein O9H85_19340 [Paenibacillus filicis]|uniref:Uncharacterized protein n=1 Tax=Paenibacillus gyeongsangnamensis TaxID=3388067 RepID=A0ABT4QCN7_9BACL|nr:hypothetical protein [Paenibacillus filicis]MCZ8514537.1 hypothetical protein [Paenibacillus filicis]
MKIETKKYEVAPLPEESQVLEVIKNAEARLAELTGSEITLIAYSKTGEES